MWRARETTLTFSVLFLSPLMSKVSFLVFSELYVTFILEWIAFIFGRGIKRRTSRCVMCKRDNSHFLRYVLISPEAEILCRP